MTLRLMACVLAVAAVQPVLAQQLRPTDERRTNAPGYFFYVLPGERTTQVSVLGSIPAPGFYEVSAGTDLGELLALAGGPAFAVRNDDIDRTITIRLYRARTGNTREIVYEQTVEAFARDGSGYPVMLDGDTVEVTTVEHRRWGWRDSLTVVGGVSTAIIAVIQIVTALQ